MKNKLSLLFISLTLYLGCTEEPDGAITNIEYSKSFFLKYEQNGIALFITRP